MEPSDLSNGSKILNEAIYRRLKNRERQRRYRERKRLKAHARNADVTKSSQMQIVPLLTNGPVEQVVTRVHCRRDWKKDARRAHVAKSEAISNAIPLSIQSLTIENHIPIAALGTREAEQTMNREVFPQSYPCSNDDEKIRTKCGKRLESRGQKQEIGSSIATKDPSTLGFFINGSELSRFVTFVFLMYHLYINTIINDLNADLLQHGTYVLPLLGDF